MNIEKIIYITETSIPSKSANLINSLKFCDAIAKSFNLKVFFLAPLIKTDHEQISFDYHLKRKFIFKSIINKEISSFFSRILFCLKCFFFCLLKKKKLIIGRSPICSFILALFQIKNTLEVHNKFTSVTLTIYKVFKKLNTFENITFILVHKNLIKELNLSKNYIVLDDASDTAFNFQSKKKYKNTCVYIGSFFEGKGLELIIKLSKLMPNINFHLYGDKSSASKFLLNRKLNTNIVINNFVKYRDIPKLLNSYDLAIMPYQKKILARSKNLEISNFISPLKMFDYLVAKNIILSSKLKAYDHILKNNINCFLVNPSNINEWKNKIYYIFKNINSLRYIRQNAKSTADHYSWDNRAKKFVKFLIK